MLWGLAPKTQLLLEEIISPPAQLPYIIISVSSADSRGVKLPILTSNVKCCKSFFFFLLIRKAEMQVGQSWSFQSHLKDLQAQIPFTFDKNHIFKPLRQLWTNSSLHSRSINTYSCSAEINRSWTHQKSIFFLLSHELTAILLSESHKKQFMFVAQRDHSNNQHVTQTI